MAEKTYPLTVDADRWERIKNTVPRNENLNDAVLERLELASFGERYERRADGRGRISLPAEAFAGRDVEVLVVGADEIGAEEEPEEVEDVDAAEDSEATEAVVDDA